MNSWNELKALSINRFITYLNNLDKKIRNLTK